MTALTRWPCGGGGRHGWGGPLIRLAGGAAAGGRENYPAASHSWRCEGRLARSARRPIGCKGGRHVGAAARRSYRRPLHADGHAAFSRLRGAVLLLTHLCGFGSPWRLYMKHMSKGFARRRCRWHGEGMVIVLAGPGDWLAGRPFTLAYFYVLSVARARVRGLRAAAGSMLSSSSRVGNRIVACLQRCVAVATAMKR